MVQVLQGKVDDRKNEFDHLQEEGGHGGQWAEHLVPVETQNQLRLDDSLPDSPVATETSPEDEEGNDFPFEEHLQQLPYFRTKMVAVTTKWGGVQRLLRDRESQLEMSLGNMVVFLEGAGQLVSWVRGRRERECVCGLPPANLTLLQTYLSGQYIVYLYLLITYMYNTYIILLSLYTT